MRFGAEAGLGEGDAERVRFLAESEFFN